MYRIHFQNGPDAVETFLGDEFETEAEAKKRLESLVHAYGTVPEAIAWLEGTKKPKFGAFADAFAKVLTPTPVIETPTSNAPEPVNPSDVPDREPNPPAEPEPEEDTAKGGKSK